MAKFIFSLNKVFSITLIVLFHPLLFVQFIYVKDVSDPVKENTKDITHAYVCLPFEFTLVFKDTHTYNQLTKFNFC